RDHILIAHGEENEEHQSSALAKASNQLLSVQDVLATFTVGRLNKNTVAISGRSSRDINVQMIMEKLGGGGHFTMAACQITDKSIDEVIEMLHNAIDAYFNERGDV
ncbi:MAG TPA: DHH family phosphoesterase, partial [Erysipelotrichaceae bacterium]|nr:DHH family phosphoesterase [Erysipelotrichaceae bacterium]